jgi:hypothetical protein
MNDIFQCGDSGALVAYLYDECAPGEQELIAAHVSRCAVCASEVEALRATRRTLAAWAPPDLALGFQITRSDVAPPVNTPATVLTPTVAWWRAPLPAWAQAAAALVIFAAGLSVGMGRAGSTDQVATTPAPSVVAADARPAAVSRDDLARLEERMKTELAQLRPAAAAPVSTRTDHEAVMRDVRALIEQSNEEQRRDFTLRMVEMASTIERQRRVDLASIGNSMGQFRGATRDELRQQNEAFSEALRRLVSESSR